MPSPRSEPAVLELTDLVDLEWALHGLRTGALDPAAVASRERGAAVAAHLGLTTADAAVQAASDRGFRQRFCADWLTLLRSESRLPGAPGRSVEGALRWLAHVATGMGVLLGASAAAGTLHFDGSRPVNVFHFIGVFFVGQILALALTVAVMGLGLSRGELRLPPLARWAGWLAVRKRLPADFVAGVQLFRGRRTIYEPIQRWTAFAALQRCGVAFNGAALVTSLILITFTDLAFSWSTTLDVSATTVHRSVAVLGAPWALVLPDAVPGAEVVEASRWDRLRRQYAGPAGSAAADRSRSWWRYLLAGLVAYGLVPRLLALILGQWRLRRAHRDVALDHGEFQRLFERLLPLGSGFVPVASAARAPRAAPDRSAAAGGDSPPALTWLVIWGRLAREPESVRALVRAEFVGDLAGVGCAGTADLRDDRAALDGIAGASPGRVVVAIEAGVQPTREFARFVGEIRQRLGPGRDVCVFMAVSRADGTFGPPDARDLESFEIRLAEMGDPHLRLRGAAGVTP